jgi:membrane-associated phospholipid phosphatase
MNDFPPDRDAADRFRRIRTVCLSGLGLLLVSTLPFYSLWGLSIEWLSALPALGGLAALLVLALYFARYPGRPSERALGDMTAVVALIVALAIVLTPAQYLAVALRRPLVDSWLARADAVMRVNVSALAAWTRSHPAVDTALRVAYFTLLPQFVVAPLLLGIVFRSRERLWEFTFHFYACALITLASLALFPAACPLQYFHFTPTISQARVVAHINALRAGTFGPLRFGEMEGLVSIPSFHAAGGLFVTWAFRGRKVVCAMFGLVNAVLILAAVLSGVHYLVDVLASFGLFGLSVLVYARLLQPASASALASDSLAKPAAA